MSRIPRHLIDEIRMRTDLVAVVERHVKLKRRGSSYVGLCPFHQEKTPSFNVIPAKHLYHCFGCNAGGDCFRFLMEIEGLSFVEAVRELAGQAGVTVEERELSPEEHRALRERASRYDALDHAARLWTAVLMTHQQGEPARRYLKERGITPDTAAHWRLGFAPAEWTASLDRLTSDGFAPELLLKTGIVRRSQKSGNLYDAFRGRLTIPIADERGRVIAFGARLLEGEGPKYVNSAEGPLYQKSATLFGLNHARMAIQRKERALLVEGYFDVISLHQAGFDEAVATCGTALTEPHVKTLRRLTDTVVALFDADEAGSRAAERALPLCFAAGIRPLRLQLPGGKDPDEVIREQGVDTMARALERTSPLLDWAVDRRVAASGGRTPSEAQVSELVDLLALTEGLDIVARVAARLKMHVEVLRQRVDAARRSRSEAATVRASEVPTDDAPEAPAWRPTLDHTHTLWLLVHRMAEVGALATAVELDQWTELEPLTDLIRRLLAGETAAQIAASLEGDPLQRLVMAVTARAELYTPRQAERGLQHIVDRFARARLDHRIAELGDQIRAAVAQHDWGAQQSASREQLALRKTRSDLETMFKQDEIDGWAALARGIIRAPA